MLQLCDGQCVSTLHHLGTLGQTVLVGFVIGGGLPGEADAFQAHGHSGTDEQTEVVGPGFHIRGLFVCDMTVFVRRPVGERSYGKPVLGCDTIVEGLCLKERLEFFFHQYLF